MSKEKPSRRELVRPEDREAMAQAAALIPDLNLPAEIPDGTDGAAEMRFMKALKNGIAQVVAQGNELEAAFKNQLLLQIPIETVIARIKEGVDCTYLNKRGREVPDVQKRLASCQMYVDLLFKTFGKKEDEETEISDEQAEKILDSRELRMILREKLAAYDEEDLVE